MTSAITPEVIPTTTRATLRLPGKHKCRELLRKRMTQHHRFNPVGTGRHDIDGRLHQLFQAFDVPASVFGQLFQRTGSHGGFLPTGHFFVDRLDLFPTFRIVGDTQGVPVRILITDADFDGVQTIEYVQLSQTDASDAIDQVRVAHRDNIKPATATLTPGGSANSWPRSPSGWPTLQPSSVVNGPEPTRVV